MGGKKVIFKKKMYFSRCEILSLSSIILRNYIARVIFYEPDRGYKDTFWATRRCALRSSVRILSPLSAAPVGV